jgi:hypothetical protein
MYDATHVVRRQYGRVEAFAPYRSPLACLNVGDTVRFGEPEEFRDAHKILFASENKDWLYWEIPDPKPEHVYSLYWSW